MFVKDIVLIKDEYVSISKALYEESFSTQRSTLLNLQKRVYFFWTFMLFDCFPFLFAVVRHVIVLHFNVRIRDISCLGYDKLVYGSDFICLPERFVNLVFQKILRFVISDQMDRTDRRSHQQDCVENQLFCCLHYVKNMNIIDLSKCKITIK